MKRFSLLELLHPDGHAATSFVLGNNCPANLLTELQGASTPKVELFILAPSAEECSSAGWLEQAVKSLSRRLSEDGLGYILAPVRWRQKIARLLRHEGLVIGPSFWHYPDWNSSHYLVPLQRGPAQFAVDSIISAPAWKKKLAKRMFHYASAHHLLGIFWTPAGISVRRPGARPLFQWLFKREQQELSPGTAILRRSWRGPRGANISYCFPERDLLPSALAKTSVVGNSSACPDREAEVLEALGPHARSAGAQVPQVLRTENNGLHSSLFVSFIPGRPISDLLESNPDLLTPVLTKVVNWLEHWHLATSLTQPLRMEQLEQALLTPMDRLAPFLQDTEAYRKWLVNQCQSVVGASMPFVATHNDLTMANILIDEKNLLGVVDWETGQAKGWPFVDFHYAIPDAVRIARGRLDWLEAFKACYEPQGSYAANVVSWQERLQTAIDISSHLSELCFHACWLHHASNEHRVSPPGAPRPFLQIVQWLALRYAGTQENHHS